MKGGGEGGAGNTLVAVGSSGSIPRIHDVKTRDWQRGQCANASRPHLEADGDTGSWALARCVMAQLRNWPTITLTTPLLFPHLPSPNPRRHVRKTAFRPCDWPQAWTLQLRPSLQRQRSHGSCGEAARDPMPCFSCSAAMDPWLLIFLVPAFLCWPMSSLRRVAAAGDHEVTMMLLSALLFS